MGLPAVMMSEEVKQELISDLSGCGLLQQAEQEDQVVMIYDVKSRDDPRVKVILNFQQEGVRDPYQWVAVIRPASARSRVRAESRLIQLIVHMAKKRGAVDLRR